MVRGLLVARAARAARAARGWTAALPLCVTAWLFVRLPSASALPSLDRWTGACRLLPAACRLPGGRYLVGRLDGRLPPAVFVAIGAWTGACRLPSPACRLLGARSLVDRLDRRLPPAACRLPDGHALVALGL